VITMASSNSGRLPNGGDLQFVEEGVSNVVRIT